MQEKVFRMKLKTFQRFAILFLILCLPSFFLGIAHARSAAQVPDASDTEFSLVMLATHQKVFARILPSRSRAAGYMLVQTQVVQPWNSNGWRLSSQSLLAIDCSLKNFRVAVVQQSINSKNDDSLPPVWVVSVGDKNSDDVIKDRVENLEKLVFNFLYMPRFINEWPQNLQAPSEHHVAASFACLVASGTRQSSEVISEAAAVIRKSGGFDDIQILKCRASGRVYPNGIDIEMRHSPAGKAVLLGDKWVMTGALYADHLSMIEGDMEFRLSRSNGVLRLVLRSEMQSVGVGECRTVA